MLSKPIQAPGPGNLDSGQSLYSLSLAQGCRYCDSGAQKINLEVVVEMGIWHLWDPPGGV